MSPNDNKTLQNILERPGTFQSISGNDEKDIKKLKNSRRIPKFPYLYHVINRKTCPLSFVISEQREPSEPSRTFWSISATSRLDFQLLHRLPKKSPLGANICFDTYTSKPIVRSSKPKSSFLIGNGLPPYDPNTMGLHLQLLYTSSEGRFRKCLNLIYVYDIARLHSKSKNM